MSSYYARMSANARRSAVKKQRDDAFRMCMLSIRGNFDPPQWALKRLMPGDMAEYRTALAAAKEQRRQEGRP